MSFRLCFLMFVSMGLLSLSQILLGQSDSVPSPQSTGAPQTMSNHHQLLITGCLKRGHEPGTYRITDENGGTWKLVSEKVDLAGQVFRVVRITAKEVEVSHQQPAPENPDDAAKAAKNTAITLRVLTLEQVSPSCTR